MITDELERCVYAALETYSNVHRGSGHFSMVTTHLFEKSREIVLEHLGLDERKHEVIFCTPRRAARFTEKLGKGTYRSVSGSDIGLPLGVVALAVEKNALPQGAPIEAGGGNARLVSPGWVIWTKAPGRFEAGTPAIMNIITFAKALRMTAKYGNHIFADTVSETSSASEILYHDELEAFSGKELLDRLRQTLVGLNVSVPVTTGDRLYVNLDNGASTPAFKPVWKAARMTWFQPLKIRKEIVDKTRSVCAGVLGAPPDDYEVIFTSNTTESVNLVAESFGRESVADHDPVILNTILEHNSNDLPWRNIPYGSLVRLKTDAEGFLDLKELESLMDEYNRQCLHGRKRIRMVAVTGASNVLGVFNDLDAVSSIVHRYGAHLLVDAAQLVAHRKIDIERCGIDYFAFSAHKVYAPFGTGVLIARKGLLNFSPVEIEQIRASGEENAPGIAALCKSLLLLQRIGFDLIREEEQALTAYVLKGMSGIKSIKIHGISDPKSAGFRSKGGVIVFEIKGMMANRLARKLAEHGGIGVRSGCHCAHILVKRLVGISPFLEKVQGIIIRLFPKMTLPGLARISLGIQNSHEDIDRMLAELTAITGQAKTVAVGQSTSMRKKTSRSHQQEIRKKMKDFTETAARRVFS